MKWYGAIGLFRHVRRDKRFVPRYEERIILLSARNRVSAERKVMREFQAYTSDEVSFLNQYEVYELRASPSSRTPLEVAWLMRTTKIKPREYVRTLWSDLRPKSCDDVGWKHCWHNRDGKTSACYNCLEVRPGQLWKDQKDRTNASTLRRVPRRN